MYSYQRAGEWVSWNGDSVAAYLTGLGYAVAPDSLACGISGSAAIVTVDCDRDPTADLAKYQPPADPMRQAQVYLRQRVAAIRATAPAQRTTGDKDILAILVMLRADS